VLVPKRRNIGHLLASQIGNSGQFTPSRLVKQATTLATHQHY
jgi:hypothetical protein